MLKTKSFGELVNFSRPSSAEYVDENGDTQIANENVPRFTYVGGEPQGIVFDSLFSETGEIIDIPLYNNDEGTWIFDGELYECIPLKNSGFTHVLNGIGQLVFTYSNGTGKCWANGEVLYTVENITPQKVTNIVAGGYATVKHVRYENKAYLDSDAASEATGSFSISDIGSLECNYSIDTYTKDDDFGAPIRSSFSDIHAISRPSPKNVWDRHGKLYEVPANVPAFQHEPSTLRTSTQTINLNNLRYRDIINLNYSGSQTFETGQTIFVSDGTDIDRYVAGEVTASEPGSVTFTVRDKAGTGIGSDWVLIQSTGFNVEPAATNHYPQWAVAGGSFDGGATSALVTADNPFGLSQILKVTQNGTGSRFYVYNSAPALENGDNTFTFCVKPGPGVGYIGAETSNTGLMGFTYNVDTEEIQAKHPDNEVIFSKLKNGFIEFSVTVFNYPGTSELLIVRANPRDGIGGTADDYFFTTAWNYNHTDSFSGHIPTDGSAVTREADVPVIENLDTAEWYGFTNGWTASLVCLAPDMPNEVYGFAMVLGPADLQRIGFYFYNGRAYAQFRAGSIFSVSVPYQPGEKMSFAASYDPATGNRSVAVNGTTDSDSLEMNFSESNVRLGNQFSGSGGGSFDIIQMHFKKRALDAAELQELTS